MRPLYIRILRQDENKGNKCIIYNLHGLISVQVSLVASVGQTFGIVHTFTYQMSYKTAYDNFRLPTFNKKYLQMDIKHRKSTD